jgi:transcriptional regulator of acetoin/glycerol metabolism
MIRNIFLLHILLMITANAESIPVRGNAYSTSGRAVKTNSGFILENSDTVLSIFFHADRAADLDLAAPAAREGETLDLRGARDRAERDVIHKALLREQGNVARAARLLGVSRPTLYEQMRNLNIRP